MGDESTDITNSKYLLCVRYMKNSTAKTLFYRTSEVSDRKAETNFQDINQVFLDQGTEGRKLAVCNDGAAVITGYWQGVVKKLTEKHHPELIGVHCTACRLALCATDAAKSEEQVNKFQQNQRSIFFFYPLH